jgi:hypothetical protein
MIDFKTYWQLHPPEYPPFRKNRTEIPPERMEADDPPSALEIYFFPSRIVGFNFRRKKWGKATSVGLRCYMLIPNDSQSAGRPRPRG